MYDELVKRIRNRRICIQQSGSLDDFPLLQEAADAIEELENKLNLCRHGKINQWTRVTERLPNECTRYLVFLHASGRETETLGFCGDLSYVTEMLFDAGQMLWVAENESYNAVLDVVDTEEEYHVTHWMPLPEPPKEET